MSWATATPPTPSDAAADAATRRVFITGLSVADDGRLRCHKLYEGCVTRR
jgi:hypothetical protein